MLKSFAMLLLLTFACILSGCTTSNVTPVSPNAFNGKPEVQDAAPSVLLVPGDSIDLSVEVDGRLEVAGHRALINNSGMVTLPLVGDVQISGMDLADAREVISKTYSSYYVTAPVIMLNRVENAVEGEWGFVTVTGRVGQPGRVKVPSAKGIKLTAAIQQSGGFAPSAKKTEIRITRQEQDGRRIQVSVDYSTIGEQGNLDADVDLKDGDVVYVPERIF